MDSRTEGADMHEQLVGKEKDLLLAAQWGKALLDINGELSRKSEWITEDYTQKLEILEQEKYQLKRKLDAALMDHAMRVEDLQADRSELHGSLEEQKIQQKQAERQHLLNVNELTEQNQRLMGQLQEASRKEEILWGQIQSLRDRFSYRKAVLSDEASDLENLRAEMEVAKETLKESHLEKKMGLLLAEKESMVQQVEKSEVAIIQLQRQNEEDGSRLRRNRDEVDEMTAENQSLSARVEILSRSAAEESSSLVNELEVSADLQGAPDGSKMDDNEGECGEGQEDSPQDESTENSIGEDYQLKDEVGQACFSVMEMCTELKGMMSSSLKREELSIEPASHDSYASIEPGLLKSSLDELQVLLWEISAVGGLMRGPIKAKTELEMRMDATEDALGKTERQISERIQENLQLEKENNRLTVDIAIREAEVAIVTEDRDNAREERDATPLGQDEIVMKAWELRDQAVQRKNKTEIEVARLKIDMMQMNRQLIDAIQQKIQLNQQLDLWQIDMQQFLDEQIKIKQAALEEMPISQIISQNSAPEGGPSPSQFERKRNKLFAMFRTV